MLYKISVAFYLQYERKVVRKQQYALFCWMELLLTSIAAFTGTNIDDIFILLLFFAHKQYKDKHVVAGQYLGFLLLVTISLLGSFIGLLIPGKYIGLLGFLPIYFGVRNMLQLTRHNLRSESENVNVNTSKSNKTLSVAAVTFANGGDNIGIYLPLFATLQFSEKVVMISIFLLMVAMWCIIAKYLSKHPAIAKAIDKYGHIVTPVVLILLGIYILFESGSFSLLR